MIHQGVSFYSYQSAYRQGKIDLEGMVAQVQALGCDGVELVPPQTPPIAYPNPTLAQIEAWFSLMEKYGTKPICWDTMIFPVDGDFDHQREQLVEELRLCHAMGFPIMRIPVGPFGRGLRVDVVESVLPLAEELDVNLGQEIHAPFTISGERVQQQIDFIQRTGTKHASLIPDMAIFATALPPCLGRKVLAAGADKELVEAIFAAFAAGEDMGKFAKGLSNIGPAEELLTFAVNNMPSKRTELLEILPYVSHFHGKFYEIDENLTEPGVRFDEVVPILVRANWEGYINSEFEGQRYHGPDDPVDEIEQVRRQHKLVERLIAETMSAK